MTRRFDSPLALAFAVLCCPFVPAQASAELERAQATLKPEPLADPSPRAPRRYDFGYNDALARVVEKLRGGTTFRAWHFSKLVLAREEGEEVDRALIAYLERSLLHEGENAPVRNVIEVMRRTGRTAFAQVLLRASQHRLRTTREAAMRALARCADAATARRLVELAPKVHVRTQALIMRVAANRLPTDEAVSFLRKLISGEITQEELGQLRYQLLQCFEEGAPEDVVRGTLEDKLGLFPKSSFLVAAKFLHRAGSENGRRALLRKLDETKEPMQRAQIIGALAERVPEASADRVLELVGASKDRAMQLALCALLDGVKTDNATAMLEVLASDDPSPVVEAALRALRGRKTQIAPRWISELEGATGSRLRQVIQALVATGDGRAVAPLVARLEAAKGINRRLYVQALGRLGHANAIAPLLEVFQAAPISFGPVGDSVSYTAVVMTNIEAIEGAAWKLYAKLDKDEVRRSHLLKTLANLARSTNDEAGKARERRIFARMKKMLMDASTPERDRLQVLHYLKPALGLEDAMRLKRLVGRGAKAGSAQFLGKLNDFLWEFF